MQQPESLNGVVGGPEPERHHADVDTADVDADADAVPQEDGEEQSGYPPPTPAKDETMVGSPTPALVPVAVGASEA